MRITGVGTFVISDGNQIDVEPAREVASSTLESFLLGPAFGELLHQRAYWPVHASAILTEMGAVICAGRSGSGKSAIAAMLAKRGYKILADEICAISLDDAPLVFPARPCLILKPDVIKELGKATTDFRSAGKNTDRYVLPLGEQFHGQGAPLHGFYILETGDNTESTLTRVHGGQKLAALTRSTYRARQASGAEPGILEHILKIASKIQAVVLLRSASTGLEQTCDLLEADFARNGLG